MTEIEATLVLRRMFPSMPQRRLATYLDKYDYPDDLPGFSEKSPAAKAAIQKAVKVAALGADCKACPCKATIYGRIRRADAKIKAEARLAPVAA